MIIVIVKLYAIPSQTTLLTLALMSLLFLCVVTIEIAMARGYTINNQTNKLFPHL